MLTSAFFMTERLQKYVVTAPNKKNKKQPILATTFFDAL